MSYQKVKQVKDKIVGRYSFQKCTDSVDHIDIYK